jgi:hypothetical protein
MKADVKRPVNKKASQLNKDLILLASKSIAEG